VGTKESPSLKAVKQDSDLLDKLITFCTRSVSVSGEFEMALWLLSSAPILVHPDSELPLDASEEGVGACALPKSYHR